MMNGFTTEPAAWTERYETLRCYVLEGRALLQAQPLGLVLLRAKGMAGWMSASWSLMRTRANRELRLTDVKAFNGWWPKWGWARPGSSWDWRCRVWRATARIGIGCWRFAG